MEIHNYKDTIRVKLLRFVYTLVCILAIIIILMEDQWFQFWENSDRQIPLIIGAVLLIYFIVDFARNYNYVYFNDDGPKIILRFYSLRMFMQVNKSIEIPKKSLYSYEILKSFGGLKTMLVLYQALEGKSFKYPPVNIRLLKKQDHNRIIQSLDKYAQNKTR